jgi:hypothetical protein
MPDRIAQQQSYRLSIGNCGRNHMGETQNLAQKLGIAEFAGTVADRNLVGKFLGDRDEVLEGGNASKLTPHPVEWSIDRASQIEWRPGGTDPGRVCTRTFISADGIAILWRRTKDDRNCPARWHDHGDNS